MPSVPTRIDGPVAVIGDVHGQVDKLRRIIEKLATVPGIASRWIVFIGDLVDRGPDPKGAVDVYCELAAQHDKVTWVCGNHELAMAGSIGLIQVPDFVDWPGRWLPHYDSDKTFDSYGVPFGDLQALRESLPEQHARLMSDLPWSVEHAKYLFVHAGLDVNLPFNMQVNILRERDYSLAHPVWLYDKSFVRGSAPSDCPVTVVVGHVPLKEVRFGQGVIGTDTTGGVMGELSCVLLPENIVITSGDDPPPGPQRPGQTQPQQKKPWWKPW
jgi:serine/threonine protein phosphatase 1